jgi:hypothetical protein
LRISLGAHVESIIWNIMTLFAAGLLTGRPEEEVSGFQGDVLKELSRYMLGPGKP